MKLTYSSQDLLFHSKSNNRFQANHTYSSGAVSPLRGLARTRLGEAGQNNLQLCREIPLHSLKVNAIEEVFII